MTNLDLFCKMISSFSVMNYFPFSESLALGSVSRGWWAITIPPCKLRKRPTFVKWVRVSFSLGHVSAKGLARTASMDQQHLDSCSWLPHIMERISDDGWQSHLSGETGVRVVASPFTGWETWLIHLSSQALDSPRMPLHRIIVRIKWSH